MSHPKISLKETELQKSKQNILDDEIKNILEKLHVVLTTLITKYHFFGKPYDFEWVEKERELRIIAKKGINE